MGVFLPIISFILFMGLPGKIYRESFLLSSVLWGVFVFLITEVLSLNHQFDRSGLSVAWAIVSAGAAAGILILKPRLSWHLEGIKLAASAIVLMVTGILLSTAIIAWNAAPNNWDSMTTHLARVAHWSQDKTIAFFPTSMLKQLNYPPWSEYAMAQFYVLGQNDQWVNFIQWFSSLGCMIGCSLIVGRLGGSVCAQALAALIVATIPMGILQSTSTQNDYVVAFWLVCFVYFGLSLLEAIEWKYCLAAGASLGLAWLIKGTGYIYAVPFLGWFFIAGFKKYGKGFIRCALVIVVLAAAINSTYYFRNWTLTSGLMPSSEAGNIIGKDLDGKVFASNFILNAGLHLASPWYGVNRSIENGIYQIHQWMGISEGDPRVCMSSGIQFQILSSSFRFHEDYAGNGVHFILIILLLLTYGLVHRKMPFGVKHYLFTVCAGIVLFLAMVKWSPFQTRYHLPEFILFSPFLAMVMTQVTKNKGAVIAAVILTGLALPWILYNKSRPLLGQQSVLSVPRLGQYFANKQYDPSDLYAMRDVMQSGCDSVGLALGTDTWEYPFWAMSRQWGRNIRFEHVSVNNVSGKLNYPLGDFQPCLIIKSGTDAPHTMQWLGRSFLKVDQQGNDGVYLSVDQAKG